MRIEFCPTGVLRSTGVPFSWLDEISLPEAAAAIDAADDVRAEAVAEAALETADLHMQEIANRELFQLAVASAYPELYERNLLPYAAGMARRRRKRRRTLVSMLQRFAAKNDTANGFGPIDRVVLDDGVNALNRAADPSRPSHRSGLLGWWIVQALANSVASDPEWQSLQGREPPKVRAARAQPRTPRLRIAEGLAEVCLHDEQLGQGPWGERRGRPARLLEGAGGPEDARRHRRRRPAFRGGVAGCRGIGRIWRLGWADRSAAGRPPRLDATQAPHIGRCTNLADEPDVSLPPSPLRFTKKATGTQVYVLVWCAGLQSCFRGGGASRILGARRYDLRLLTLRRAWRRPARFGGFRKLPPLSP